MKKISVLAVPAKENRKDNPYNYILYSSMEALNVNVMAYSLRSFVRAKNYDLVHFHWPENFLAGKSGWGAVKAFAVFALKLAFLKLCRKKIVWTVHNFAPHDNKKSRTLLLFYKMLYRCMDGFISLTAYGAEEIKKSAGIPPEKIAVVPHPHYADYYPNNIGRQAAREKLGISQNGFVFLFIGQVRAYKNVIGLVEAFKKLSHPDAVLLIAGKVHPDVADELEGTVKGEERILRFPSFISDDDLQLYLNAADLVVNPFHKILNSGSVFLNLSFARPTLVPATGSLLELQQQAGPSWIKTFDGKLTAAALEQGMKEISEQETKGKPDLSAFHWQAVAQQTKSFYQQLLGNEKHLPSFRGFLLQSEKTTL